MDPELLDRLTGLTVLSITCRSFAEKGGEGEFKVDWHRPGTGCVESQETGTRTLPDGRRTAARNHLRWELIEGRLSLSHLRQGPGRVNAL